ncbi:MAG TPA: peptidase inhibitor family I36 protein [Actinophytocola sp.]|nr:peptidase inhibitor family I36 protein [Actinophytocola sp.]
MSAIGGSVVMVAAVAGTASAATPRNGVCEVGEFCLYWGPDRTGSLSDFNGSIPDYGSIQPTCYDFKGAGQGQGVCVKDKATSAWNRTTANTVTVYYHINYGNPSDVFAPGQAGNLNNTYLHNESHRFVHN